MPAFCSIVLRVAVFALLTTSSLAGKQSTPVPPTTGAFTKSSKWTGTLTTPDGPRTVDAKLTDLADTDITLRLSTGKHGTRDWKLAVKDNKLSLVSCLASSASNDTQLKNPSITGTVTLDPNGAATCLTLTGTWLYQTKRAGGTERITLMLKRAGK